VIQISCLTRHYSRITFYLPYAPVCAVTEKIKQLNVNYEFEKCICFPVPFLLAVMFHTLNLKTFPWININTFYGTQSSDYFVCSHQNQIFMFRMKHGSEIRGPPPSNSLSFVPKMSAFSVYNTSSYTVFGRFWIPHMCAQHIPLYLLPLKETQQMLTISFYICNLQYVSSPLFFLFRKFLILFTLFLTVTFFPK